MSTEFRTATGELVGTRWAFGTERRAATDRVSGFEVGTTRRLDALLEGRFGTEFYGVGAAPLTLAQLVTDYQVTVGEFEGMTFDVGSGEMSEFYGLFEEDAS